LGTYDEVVLLWRWVSCRIESSGEKKWSFLTFR
jgi:hypothetical protein